FLRSTRTSHESAKARKTISQNGFRVFVFSWLTCNELCSRGGVRAVAAIPAIALLAGSAIGLLAPDIPRTIALPFLIACAAVSVWAWRFARTLVLAASVALGFFAGAAFLAADAWREAWRPTLRIVFDDLGRAARAEAAADDRVLPEDDEAFAVVEGVLRQDGAITPTGASLSIDVDAICSAT